MVDGYLKKTFACSDIKKIVKCIKPTQSRCLVARLLSKNKRKKLQGTCMDYRNTAGICAEIRETNKQVLFSEDFKYSQCMRNNEKANNKQKVTDVPIE